MRTPNLILGVLARAKWVLWILAPVEVVAGGTILWVLPNLWIQASVMVVGGVLIGAVAAVSGRQLEWLHRRHGDQFRSRAAPS